MRHWCLLLAVVLGLSLSFTDFGQNRRRPAAPEKTDPETEKHLDWIIKDVEAGWSTFSLSDNFMFKYDPRSLEWISQTTLTARIREYPAFGLAKGRAQVIEERKSRELDVKGYDHYDMSAAQITLDCASKEAKSSLWKDYDINRAMVGDLPDSPAIRILPGSVEENLFNILCRENYESPTHRLPKKALLGY